MTRIAGKHTLRHDIVRETQPQGGEETVEEVLKPKGFCVVVRRSKAKDLRIMDTHGNRPMAMTEAFIARLTPLTEEEVANLDSDDWDFLAELCVPNISDGQETGKTA